MKPPFFAPLPVAVRPTYLAPAVLIVAIGGCIPSAEDRMPVTPAAAVAPAGPIAELTDSDTWEAVYMQGTKVGHAHVQRRRVQDGGETRIRVEIENRLRLERFGESVEQTVHLTSVETLDGRLLSFETEVEMGSAPLRARGHMEGDRLVVETTAAGRTDTQQLEGAAKNGGFYAVENSLARRPMQPGEVRALETLEPMMSTPVRVTLTAGQFEKVDLLAGTEELLRVDRVVALPDEMELKDRVWTDRAGEILKTQVPSLGVESFRTTRANALAKPEPGAAGFDLGLASMVRLAEPLPGANSAKRIRYRVRLRDGDPATAFADEARQQITPIDSRTAELIVHSTYGDAPGDPSFDATSKPKDAYRAPNTLIQSDDPGVIALAREAAPAKLESIAAAHQIEQFVHRAVHTKNFSQAFATAAEVAATREGDCTEHAVLLAAMARARGIPARVAVGLVYVESQQAFGFHMWSEAYARGQWIPLDGTLGRQGVGAAHLKLADSSLSSGTAISCFLPVAEVLGQLEIEVLEVD